MVHDILIIGSGAAGLTAAIYACRSNLNPVLIEGIQPGGQLTITNDVENYPGFVDPVSGPALMADMRRQAERFGVRIMAGEVSSVNLGQWPFVVKVGSQCFEARTLVVATGASAKWLGLKSEQKLYGRGVSACATCDGFFYRDKEVVGELPFRLGKVSAPEVDGS